MTLENPCKPFWTSKAKLTFLIAAGKISDLVLNTNLAVTYTKPEKWKFHHQESQQLLLCWQRHMNITQLQLNLSSQAVNQPKTFQRHFAGLGQSGSSSLTQESDSSSRDGPRYSTNGFALTGSTVEEVILGNPTLETEILWVPCYSNDDLSWTWIKCF